MTVLDSNFCTVETTTWLWKFLSSSLPQCLCQEHEEICSQTKSRRRNRNHSLMSDKNKTNDLILNLTPENVTQHSRIVTTTRKGSSTPTKMSKIIGRKIH